MHFESKRVAHSTSWGLGRDTAYKRNLPPTASRHSSSCPNHQLCLLLLVIFSFFFFLDFILLQSATLNLTMDNYHACSSVISEFEARKAGAFTSLPIRVNRYSEVATKAAQDFVCKWNCHFDVGSNYPGSTSATRFGPRDSPLVMIIPEAQPDRLATAACLTEMARLLDGKPLQFLFPSCECVCVRRRC